MPSDRFLQRCARRCWQSVQAAGAQPNQGWLLAVSGGVDSLALFRIAKFLAEQHGFRIEIAHIDHGMRTSSSSEAQVLKTLLHDQVCHVLSIHVDVCSDGPEAAARARRYQALQWIRQQRDLDHIVTGHTADDQAETVLMRLLKGSGMRGLGGMQIVHQQVLRPMLSLRRRDSEQLAAFFGGPVCDDASNRDLHLLRARIRQQTLPFLQAEFGDLTPKLSALAEELAQANTYLDSKIKGLVPTPVDAAVVVLRHQIAELPEVLRARWLLAALTAIDRYPRRARASLQQFGMLVGQTKDFYLHLAGAEIRAKSELLVVQALPFGQGRSGRSNRMS